MNFLLNPNQNDKRSITKMHYQAIEKFDVQKENVKILGFNGN